MDLWAVEKGSDSCLKEQRIPSFTSKTLKNNDLCTVSLTLTNYKGNDITTSHVFSSENPLHYPQTRRTLIANPVQMPVMQLQDSQKSTVMMNKNDYIMNNNPIYAPVTQKHIVQEISLTYSRPYTTVKHGSNRDSNSLKSKNYAAITNSVETKKAKEFEEIITENMICEELTTMRTNNQFCKRDEFEKITEMPTVNDLKKHFESVSRGYEMKNGTRSHSPLEVVIQKPKSGGYSNKNVELRQTSDIYATYHQQIHMPINLITKTIVNINSTSNEPPRTCYYDNSQNYMPVPTQVVEQQFEQKNVQKKSEEIVVVDASLSKKKIEEKVVPIQTIEQVLDQKDSQKKYEIVVFDASLVRKTAENKTAEANVPVQTKDIEHVFKTTEVQQETKKTDVLEEKHAKIEQVEKVEEVPVETVVDQAEELLVRQTEVEEETSEYQKTIEFIKSCTSAARKVEEKEHIDIGYEEVPKKLLTNTPEPEIDVSTYVENNIKNEKIMEKNDESVYEENNLKNEEITERSQRLDTDFSKSVTNYYTEQSIKRQIEIYEETKRKRSMPSKSEDSFSDYQRSTQHTPHFDAKSRGFISGGLLSGISEAGAICTAQIRDAREREKREIGLLNDRLADYIEKVRFLEAQNRVLSEDIDILKRGFTSGGHVSGIYESEIAQATSVVQQTIANRSGLELQINSLTGQIGELRNKWLEATAAVKAHRQDHDVDLDRLAKIEAESSIFRRKIKVVEEDIIRIRRENERIYHELSTINGNRTHEIALKNERSLHIQDLLHSIKALESENSLRIDQELVFIRRDTTAENRDYFRHELQAAIREIRADYETISHRNRQDLEIWYRDAISKIKNDTSIGMTYQYKDELVSIRTTVGSLRTRLAELESRNVLLEQTIHSLAQQQADEAKLYEISLAEKDAAIAKLRDQCTELTIQMEKLCDHQISLQAEIERYRVLLSNANVTTYTTNNGHSYGSQHYAGQTRIHTTTTRTHSDSNTSYRNLPTRAMGSIQIGDTNIAGRTASSSVVGGNVVAGKRPDRIHDEHGEDAVGRSYHRWYKGTISINEITESYIELKNICIIRRVDVGGFRVEHKVNGQLVGSFSINRQLVLNPQESLRIYSNAIHNLPQDSFVMHIPAFDTSVHSRTSIYNDVDNEEERGFFIYLN